MFEDNAPIVHVVFVESGLGAYIIAAAYLPKPGYARPDAYRPIIHKLRHGYRPWPDEGHLAANDVYQLRQCIKVPSSKHHPNRGDPRVESELLILQPIAPFAWVMIEIFIEALIGVWDHGPELDASEWLPSRANATAQVKYGAAVESNRRRDQNHKWKSED